MCQQNREEIKIYVTLIILPIPKQVLVQVVQGSLVNLQHHVLWRKCIREELEKKDPALPRLSTICVSRVPEWEAPGYQKRDQME